MNFGRTFRKIRKQRKLSLKKLAGEEISYSFLATFEREESMISFETLSLLLKKMQLSLDEFFCLSLTNKAETEYEIFSKKASNFLYSQNSKGLSNLAKQEFLKSKESDFLFHKCNEIICKTVQSTFDTSISISDSEKKFIMDYLWNIEIWTKYELSVLNYSLPAINTSSLPIFINEIWKSLPDDFLTDKLHSYKFNLINSMIGLLIETDEFTTAKKWIKKLKNKLNGSQDFFEMIYLYMLELILEKKTNSSFEVDKKYNDLKNILFNIGAENYVKHFELEWNRVV
ncbi:helix-turn-helix domain-containing protein [Listeria monocytogenes]